MELNEDGFLEELLALRRETWGEEEDQISNTTGVATAAPAAVEINSSLFSSTSWAFDGLDSVSDPTTQQASFESFSSSIEPTSCCLDNFYVNSTTPLVEPSFHVASMIEDEVNGGGERLESGSCKPEPAAALSPGEVVPASNYGGGICMESNSNHSNSNSTINNGVATVVKSKIKKIDGQPSKNLMAERRRRKRLNDRLSMLRSVVPKISKMDRTSILGDTIDYMKELLERINSLQEETHDVGSSQLNMMSVFKDFKSNDVLVRNSPKFDVERRNLDTRVEICCAGKPGLLLSTVTTLEALGLNIQQCVISCFNDFSVQALCSEEMEQRTLLSSEDIKQALFRNAGYGGRCL